MARSLNAVCDKGEEEGGRRTRVVSLNGALKTPYQSLSLSQV